MLGQQQYQIDLQLGLDILALVPVGVPHLVVHHGFYLGGQREQLVVGVAEIVFDGQLFENVVEPRLPRRPPHLARQEGEKLAW